MVSLKHGTIPLMTFILVFMQAMSLKRSVLAVLIFAKFQAFLDILGPPSHYHADFVQDIETGILDAFCLSE